MIDRIGDRMKAYEDVSRANVTPRMPVIVRVDGRAFHSYFRKVEKPFSAKANDAMRVVMSTLFHEVAGAQMAYQQSDEISLLVHPYKRFTSQCWFGGNIQKIVSIAAAVASTTMTEESMKVFGARRIATFDARCFVLPEADVQNYFLWRQRDAIRNSIQSFGRHILGPRAMQGRNGPTTLQACLDAGHDWETEMPAEARFGSWTYRSDQAGLLGAPAVVMGTAPKFDSSATQTFRDFLSVTEQ